MKLFAFFLPGPMELVLGLLCLGVLVAIVMLAVMLSASQKGRSDPAANPNLFPCPDCGHFASRRAPSCPQCGRPLSPPEES